MYLEDGDEKDVEGQGKERDVSLSLYRLEDEEESTQKVFVHLDIAVYSWIGSVAQAPPGLVRSEDS
jgi:hypothetical protein